MNDPATALSTPVPAQGLVAVEQQRAVAEAQAAMVVARASPRDQDRALQLILTDCKRLALAESAMYVYARGGTEITGPSIRLMETIARRWGNIECGVKELTRRNGSSECLAYAWDLETNYRETKLFHVKHWRDTKKGGYAVTDERDIYELVANYGARRKRACIQAVVPGEVVESAVQACELTLRQADTSPEQMRKMVEAFRAFGVTAEMIEKRIQRRLETIAPAQMISLKKIYMSLRDGMSKPSEFFDMPAGASASSDLNERLRSTKAKAPEPESKAASGPAPSSQAE
jgi:hypothetical protein